MSYAAARFSGMVTDYDQMLTAALNPSGPYAFLRKLGAALEKGRRKDVRVLDDGSVELVVKYDRLGDMLAVLTDLDALKAMARVDPEGAPQ
jgi:hypothetical protein